MKKSTAIGLWIFLIAALVCAITWQYYPLDDAKDRLEQFPNDSITFSGEDIPLSPFEEDFFSKTNLIKRLYQVGDTMYFVTVVDATENRHVVHDPYYCFRGGGWDVIDSKDVKIPGGVARLVDIQKNGIRKEALFWFSDEKTRYSSAFRYWLQATLRRLTLGASGPEPVLITVQPINKEKIDINTLVEDFPPIFKL